ncbi:hypothetical protein Busp01_57460 [Trinickia caryophylli]|nr:hypothetical protein Busp01_57460 [Trinickia caryophylli]
MARQQRCKTAGAECNEQSITAGANRYNKKQMLTGDRVSDNEYVFRTHRGEQSEAK